MIYSDSDIREYFLDNEVPDFTRGEVAEFRSRRAWIKLEDFEPIKIALDRVDLFTYFCNLYDIPYVKDGERLQVLKTGKEAKDDLKAASDALENEGYGWAVQNPRLFRNDRDRTVIVFCPHESAGDVDQFCGYYIGGFDVNSFNYRLFGENMGTVVVTYIGFF